MSSIAASGVQSSHQRAHASCTAQLVVIRAKASTRSSWMQSRADYQTSTLKNTRTLTCRALAVLHLTDVNTGPNLIRVMN